MKERLSEDKRFASIEENIKYINDNVALAALESGRKAEEIQIMAVTKTVEPLYINYAISCGIKLIGENRVQEYLGKVDSLNVDGCEVHLIGHLQTNKVRQIICKVSMIQSVDSIKIAQEIGKMSTALGVVTPVLMEVNVGAEVSKFGFSMDSAIEKAYELAAIKGIQLQGIMSVPPISDDEKIIRQNFSNIKGLFIDIYDKRIDNGNMIILSMGMSGDYRQAIIEGSNLIRVGSAIFGIRKY